MPPSGSTRQRLGIHVPPTVDPAVDRRAARRRRRARQDVRLLATLLAMAFSLGAVTLFLVWPHSGSPPAAVPLALGEGNPIPAPNLVSPTHAESPPVDQAMAAVLPAASATSLALSRSWEDDPSTLRQDAGLVAALDPILGGVSGRIGLAVKDLGSGRGALFGARQEMPAASVFKLQVLYTVFEAKLPMSERLEITDRIKEYDLGTLDLPVGDSLSVAEALERMVTISDNSSAILLADRAGPGRVNADMIALGLDQTHYLGDRLTTSARDMLVLLERIARAQAVSPEASADMLHLLLRQKVNDRLPRLLPPGVQVAHKTGNLDGITNDVGIIYGQRSTLVVSMLVSDTLDEDAAADAVARVARASLAYFDALPASPSRPLVLPPPNRPVPPLHRAPLVVPSPSAVPIEADAAAEDEAPTVTPTRALATSTPRATPTQTPRPTATATATATSTPTR